MYVSSNVNAPLGCSYTKVSVCGPEPAASVSPSAGSTRYGARRRSTVSPRTTSRCDRYRSPPSGTRSTTPSRLSAWNRTSSAERIRAPRLENSSRWSGVSTVTVRSGADATDRSAGGLSALGSSGVTAPAGGSADGSAGVVAVSLAPPAPVLGAGWVTTAVLSGLAVSSAGTGGNSRFVPIRTTSIIPMASRKRSSVLIRTPPP